MLSHSIVFNTNSEELNSTKCQQIFGKRRPRAQSKNSYMSQIRKNKQSKTKYRYGHKINIFVRVVNFATGVVKTDRQCSDDHTGFISCHSSKRKFIGSVDYNKQKSFSKLTLRKTPTPEDFLSIKVSRVSRNENGIKLSSIRSLQNSMGMYSAISSKVPRKTRNISSDISQFESINITTRSHKRPKPFISIHETKAIKNKLSSKHSSISQEINFVSHAS